MVFVCGYENAKWRLLAEAMPKTGMRRGGVLTVNEDERRDTPNTFLQNADGHVFNEACVGRSHR